MKKPALQYYCEAYLTEHVQLFPNAAPVSQLSIVLLSIVVLLVVIIVLIIVSVIVIYYKKKQKKKIDEYDYVETYSLPSNPNTTDNQIVAISDNPAYEMSSSTRDHYVATSDNPAYGMHPASESTQPTVSDELPIEQFTTAIYEDIPQ